MKLENSTNRTCGPLYPGRGARRFGYIASAVLLVISVSNALAQAKPVKATSTVTVRIKAAANSPVVKVAPGSLLVYVDTKTLVLDLEPGVGRVPLELSADMLNALNTSGEGLTPITQNGITRVAFKGRYHPVWVAVTDSKGKVVPFCITGLPAPVQVAARAVRESQGDSHER